MDGDDFFVGVEVAKNPKLIGLPVITGEERGIVTALSYEAKALGVVRGMPTYRVKKDFPSVIVLPGDYSSYAQYSKNMFDVVRRYTDDVEEYSIDECFADLTGLVRPLRKSYKEIAETIQNEIQHELGLSVSVGVAPTKVLAKIASSWKKPHGLTVVPGKRVHEFLVEIPILKVWGIGPQTSRFLIKKSIRTAYDFARKDVSWVRSFLSKPYEDIWNELNCRQVHEIDSAQKTTYSSIQKTRSFSPATDNQVFLLSQISKHVEDACSKARHYKLAPQSVSVMLKTKSFRYVSSEIKLLQPTNIPELLLPFVQKEFFKIYTKGTIYRTTGITLRELHDYGKVVQIDLFGDTFRAQRLETIHAQIDELECKFGKRIVHLASTHNALQNKPKGTETDGHDRDLLFL